MYKNSVKNTINIDFGRKLWISLGLIWVVLHQVIRGGGQYEQVDGTKEGDHDR